MIFIEKGAAPSGSIEETNVIDDPPSGNTLGDRVKSQGSQQKNVVR